MLWTIAFLRRDTLLLCFFAVLLHCYIVQRCTEILVAYEGLWAETALSFEQCSIPRLVVLCRGFPSYPVFFSMELFHKPFSIRFSLSTNQDDSMVHVSHTGLKLHAARRVTPTGVPCSDSCLCTWHGHCRGWVVIFVCFGLQFSYHLGGGTPPKINMEPGNGGFQ